ncbi:MAG: hypothetical protein KGJ57_04090 [Sphingomonadales bacterium]|nr:hypothetical protein [Sphingomonadales bacterium]MDE2168593.1 hypothetical protein [Sphingomonadales bacterium]
MRKVMVGVLGCAVLLGGCVEQRIARSRVQNALTNAGLSLPMAQCMSARMVDHLTIKQLRKLEALQGPKRTTFDYIAAVRRVDDPETIEVAVTAAGACAAQVGTGPMGLGGLLR